MEYRRHLLNIDKGCDLEVMKNDLIKLGCNKVIIGDSYDRYTEVSITYSERFEKGVLHYIDASPEIHLVA